MNTADRVSRRVWTRLLVAIAGAGAFLFIKLASEIAEGETRRFDEAILHALRIDDGTRPIGPAWVASGLIDLTALGSPAVLTLVTVMVAGFLVCEGRRVSALVIGASVTGGAILSTVLKASIARPRPDIISHLVNVSTASFPSGHAMLSAVTYLTLGVLLTRHFAQRRTRVMIAASTIMLTGLVGLSRVYLGVHYPSDVLGGWCVGTAWAAFCIVIADMIERRQA